MTGAVAVVRQRHALARRALSRGRAALERVAVRVVALPRHLREPFVGGGDVTAHDAIDALLAAHREVKANVVEQRSCRPREIVAIRDHALDRGLAGCQHAMVVDPSTAIARVRLEDLLGELAVDRPTDVKHEPSLLDWSVPDPPPRRVSACPVKVETQGLLTRR